MQIAKIGRWAFILGVVVAIILGFTSFSYSTLILVMLGLIVGFLNISYKETDSYLIAVVAMLVIGFSGLQVFTILNTGIYDWIETVLTSFITFVAASGLVVAVRSIIRFGEE
jgi:hypothetical protein